MFSRKAPSPQITVSPLASVSKALTKAGSTSVVYVTESPLEDLPFESVGRSVLAKNLHLKTTHIYNHDGSINEDGWKEFEIFVSKDQTCGRVVVSKSKMEAYLEHCQIMDLKPVETGINAYAFFAYANKQTREAIAEWNEVYHRFACGWMPNETRDDLEPYIDLSLIRLFFQNSRVAYLRAEHEKLPVPKPTFAFVPTAGFRG